MTKSNEGERSSRRRIKVVRLIEEYGFDGIGAEMERRWTASGDERTSLRGLAELFNQRLLAEAMAVAGLQPLGGEVENTYRLLTDDKTSSADQTRTQRRLEHDGVSVEDLRANFVTYQAIRTFLTDHREVEYASGERNRVAVEAENVRRLRGRTKAVTEEKVDRLRRNNDLDLGEFMLVIDMSILCEDCGAQYQVTELLDQGGCDCP